MHFSIWPKLQRMIHFHANLFNLERLKCCESTLLPPDIILTSWQNSNKTKLEKIDFKTFIGILMLE